MSIWPTKTWLCEHGVHKHWVHENKSWTYRNPTTSPLFRTTPQPLPILPPTPNPRNTKLYPPPPQIQEKATISNANKNKMSGMRIAEIESRCEKRWLRLRFNKSTEYSRLSAFSQEMISGLLLCSFGVLHAFLPVLSGWKHKVPLYVFKPVMLYVFNTLSRNVECFTLRCMFSKTIRAVVNYV